MSTTTTTTLQELLQCEEDSFIPDDLDDKIYDDHTYNWEVMFETVKFFLMKEGGGRDGREEDKRYVIMADGSTVLRDLAVWMGDQRQNKFKEKLSDERERKLNSIRFMWDRWEHEWHAMFCAVKRFKDKEGGGRDVIRQRTSERWCGRWQSSAKEDLAAWMGTQR